MDPPSQANCITVHFQKCVYSVEGSLFRGKKQFFFLQLLPRVMRTWAKTRFYPPWKPRSGTSKDEIERQLDPTCAHTVDQCSRTPAQHPLVELLNYVCPPSLALCISTQSSEHNWVVACVWSSRIVHKYALSDNCN